MSDEISPDPAYIRKVAERELESVVRFQSIILEEHANAFRWLLASLLAVNAGAAIAVLSSNNITGQWKLYALGCYCLGLLASIAAGRTSQSTNVRALPLLRRKQNFWQEALHTGLFNEEAGQKLDEEELESRRRSWPTQALGWLSSVLFVAGTVCAGVGLSTV